MLYYKNTKEVQKLQTGTAFPFMAAQSRVGQAVPKKAAPRSETSFVQQVEDFFYPNEKERLAQARAKRDKEDIIAKKIADKYQGEKDQRAQKTTKDSLQRQQYTREVIKAGTEREAAEKLYKSPEEKKGRAAKAALAEKAQRKEQEAVRKNTPATPATDFQWPKTQINGFPYFNTPAKTSGDNQPFYPSPGTNPYGFPIAYRKKQETAPVVADKTVPTKNTAPKNVAGTSAPKKPSYADKVRKIQQSLGVKADGIWGPETQGAFDRMKTTQTSLGVKADGIRGKDTTAAIYKRDKEVVDSVSKMRVKGVLDPSEIAVPVHSPKETRREVREFKRDLRREARGVRRAERAAKKNDKEVTSAMRGGGLFYNPEK